MAENRRRVVLFGLSANPPTGMGGHAGIVHWAASRPAYPEFEGQPADEVWVLPVFEHAFQNKRTMPSFEHRLAMAKLAFEPGTGGLSNRRCSVRVLPAEKEVTEELAAIAKARGQPAPLVGTIDVVQYLMKRHPDADFALLLGADTYHDLRKGRWKQSKLLEQLVRVVVVPRMNVSLDERSVLPDAPPLSEVSSSAVRRSRDRRFLSAALQPEVLEYIVQHQLYAFAETPPSDAAE